MKSRTIFLKTNLEYAWTGLVCLLLLLNPIAATASQRPVQPNLPFADPAPAWNDWSQAGYAGNIPNLSGPIVNVKNAGAVGDGVSNDAAAIQNAINNAPNPAVIFLPAGTYRIEAALNLQSGIVLRGEGYRQTHVECLSSSGCFNINGAIDGSFVNVQSGLTQGSTQIVVADASDFIVGQGAEIQQDDIIPASATWGENAVGQMVKIAAISGNTLTIDPPLHIAYSLDKSPKIRPIRLVEQVGIEDLHLKRLDGSGDGDSNFNIRRAANCWFRRIESEWTEKYHFAVGESLYLEIRDSYIHDAHSKGDGGEGYGTSLGRHVTSVLVENNIFNKVRHAMIVQIGTNGCVFGYNYARRNYSDDGWDKTAISLHGHYPFLNLYESNVVGWAGLDNVWGANGPDNTLFRNRVVGTDRHQEFGQYRGIWVQGFHGPQYLVGNEINTIGSQSVGQDGIYIPADANGNPADVVTHGNNIRGTLSWNPAWPQTLPGSYYLSGKPGFYGAMAWPSLGGDQPFGQGKIPAMIRWETGEYVPSPAEGNTLELTGIPGDQTIRLNWDVSASLPATSTWQISYVGPAGDQPSPITGIPGLTRTYTLTGLTNYEPYLVTFSTVGVTPPLSDTVHVMPTDIQVFLPLVSKE